MATGVDSLRKGVNKILQSREKIGAALKSVSLVTRSWSGSRVGEGTAEDSSVAVRPTPRVKPFAHDLRIREGGAIKQGDILIKGISKQNFPDEDQIDGSSDAKNIEKFYEIGNKIYQVIEIRERHLTWDVQVRRLSDQRRF